MRMSIARTPLCLALAATQLLAAGCCCNRLGRVPNRYRHAQESGIAVIGDDYLFSANTTISSDQPVLVTVRSNERVAHGRDHAYPAFRAYVDPEVTRGSPADMHVNFTTPLLEIITGWAYLVGVSPMGRTTRVRAVGEGTRIIIEVDHSVTPEVHRVYFVGDKRCSVHVYVPADEPPPPAIATPVYTMTELRTYLEVYDDGSWKYMGSYADDPERAAFVASVIDDSKDALSP